VEACREYIQRKDSRAWTVETLLVAFFLYFHHCFPYMTHVVSIRSYPRHLTKEEHWQRSVSGGKNYKSWRISIEDPFETNRDLGSVLQWTGQHVG
jgi:DNA polymerase sigma